MGAGAVPQGQATWRPRKLRCDPRTREWSSWVWGLEPRSSCERGASQARVLRGVLGLCARIPPQPTSVLFTAIAELGRKASGQRERRASSRRRGSAAALCLDTRDTGDAGRPYPPRVVQVELVPDPPQLLRDPDLGAHICGFRLRLPQGSCRDKGRESRGGPGEAAHPRALSCAPELQHAVEVPATSMLRSGPRHGRCRLDSCHTWALRCAAVKATQARGLLNPKEVALRAQLRGSAGPAGWRPFPPQHRAPPPHRYTHTFKYIKINNLKADYDIKSGGQQDEQMSTLILTQGETPRTASATT